MNLTTSVRVGVDYKGLLKAVVLPLQANQKQILYTVLESFEIPKDHFLSYVLTIKSLGCKVESTATLFKDEILTLVKLQENEQEEEISVLCKASLPAIR